MTDRERIAEEAKEKIDGFLTDLESDSKQYGLTDSIRESARAVFFQIIEELGYIRQPEINPNEIPHAAYDKYFTPPEPPKDKVKAVKKVICETCLKAIGIDKCLSRGWPDVCDFCETRARKILKLFPEPVLNKEAGYFQEEAELVNRLIDRGWIPPEEAKSYVKLELVVEWVKEHDAHKFIDNYLLIPRDEWQAKIKEWGKEEAK